MIPRAYAAARVGQAAFLLSDGFSKKPNRFFRPFGASWFPPTHPGLAPWAAILRRSAAALRHGLGLQCCDAARPGWDWVNLFLSNRESGALRRRNSAQGEGTQFLRTFTLGQTAIIASPAGARRVGAAEPSNLVPGLPRACRSRFWRDRVGMNFAHRAIGETTARGRGCMQPFPPFAQKAGERVGQPETPR